MKGGEGEGERDRERQRESFYRPVNHAGLQQEERRGKQREKKDAFRPGPWQINHSVNIYYRVAN